MQNDHSMQVFSYVVEANGSGLGNKTLAALTFKLSVTQILTQVANDTFFFRFDDAIIPDMLHEMFVVNDSIHEEKFDTEEETSAKVAEFLEFGTELDKQEKALAISKKIVETTDLAQTERKEILAKLDELLKRFEEKQMEAASASEAKDVMSDGKVSPKSVTASPKRFGKTSAARVPADAEERTTALSSMPNLSGTTMTGTTADTSGDALSASSDALLRTTSSDGAAKPKKKKSKQRKTLRKKKESTTLKFNPNKKESKYSWVQGLRGESKTERTTTRPNRKSSKKNKLSQVRRGLHFVNLVSEQVERRKLKKQKLEKDSKRLQVWLKTKTPKKQKKRPKFDLKAYAARTSGTMDIHAVEVGGMRSPYYLQGVQFVPAERLGAWREENASGRKKWSSAFHTAEFPAAPDRAQTHKLKNQATARRAIQPKLITFGDYGEVEWLTCIKSQDTHYQLHAENMKRLQMVRERLMGEHKNDA